MKQNAQTRAEQDLAIGACASNRFLWAQLDALYFAYVEQGGPAGFSGISRAKLD